jgi:hypothetical protein
MVTNSLLFELIDSLETGLPQSPKGTSDAYCLK